VATVACLGGAVRPSCGRTAASLRLGDGIRPLPLGPSRSYASRMTAVLRRLQRDRRRALSDLRAADTHRGQSRAATKVADAHKRAASALRRTTRTPLERRAHLNLLTATERAGSAWRSLALAARRDEPSRYARARSAVRRHDRLLSRRVAALGELGYTVR
jgi:hypothetical protein